MDAKQLRDLSERVERMATEAIDDSREYRERCDWYMAGHLRGVASAYYHCADMLCEAVRQEVQR